MKDEACHACCQPVTGPHLDICGYRYPLSRNPQPRRHRCIECKTIFVCDPCTNEMYNSLHGESDGNCNLYAYPLRPQDYRVGADDRMEEHFHCPNCQ